MSEWSYAGWTELESSRCTGSQDDVHRYRCSVGAVQMDVGNPRSWKLRPSLIRREFGRECFLKRACTLSGQLSDCQTCSGALKLTNCVWKLRANLANGSPLISHSLASTLGPPKGDDRLRGKGSAVAISTTKDWGNFPPTVSFRIRIPLWGETCLCNSLYPVNLWSYLT